MVQLKEIKEKAEIQSPVLRQMVNYTSENEIQFLFVVNKDNVQKGIIIIKKDTNSELQMLYYGSHYLLREALPLYEKAIQEKIAHLPK